MAKIYVASSWRNGFQPGVVSFLREHGHSVYDFRNPPEGTAFKWSDIDPNWKGWSTQEYRRALQSPTARAGFNSDFGGMQWADTCVLVLPCGRSANSEAGWMKGAGKHVIVYSPVKQEPELMYNLYDYIADDLKEVVAAIAAIKSVKAAVHRAGNYSQGESVFISPDATGLSDWHEAVVDRVKNILGRTLITVDFVQPFPYGVKGGCFVDEMVRREPLYGFKR